MSRTRLRVGDVVEGGGGRRYVVIKPLSATLNNRRRQVLCWLVGKSTCQTVAFTDARAVTERDERSCIDALYWLAQGYLRNARRARIERTRAIWLRQAAHVAHQRSRLCRLFGDDPRREPGQAAPTRRRLAS